MSWLTNWDEAREHPWRTRAFLFASFAFLTIFLAALVHVLVGNWLAVGGTALLVGAAVTAACEPLLRQAPRPRRKPTARETLVRTAAALAILNVGIFVVGGATHSAFAAGIFITLGIVVLGVATQRRS